jgi:hypothetical protein
MPISGNVRSAAAIHRKMRALAAVLLDPATTEHERANAKNLKLGLEKQLMQETPPEGSWSSIMFQLGRGVKEMTSPPPFSNKNDRTASCFRLGRMLCKGFKGK